VTVTVSSKLTVELTPAVAASEAHRVAVERATDRLEQAVDTAPEPIRAAWDVVASGSGEGTLVLELTDDLCSVTEYIPLADLRDARRSGIHFADAYRRLLREGSAKLLRKLKADLKADLAAERAAEVTR
jgi:hypothetical protein